ncbi:MAG: hypothetical protein E6G30_08725 [Actinobacteria bacterium]|nr:MAG: hypothetical protein E6G30_08725 [Actinomycetota bacterium]
MRARALAAAACAAGLALAGCGGGPSGNLDRSLSYFPATTPAVAVVTTDLDDVQWHTFNGQIAPLVVHASVRTLLHETADRTGLSFGDDLKALLGNPLVIGLVPGAGPGRPVVAALQVRDAGRLPRVLRALGFVAAGSADGARLYRPPLVVGRRLAPAPRGRPALLAVDRDVLVAAGSARVLRRALAGRRRGGRLTETLLRRALPSLPTHPFLRVYGSLRTLAGGVGGNVPWFRALRSYGLAVKLKQRVIEARAVVRTASGRVRLDQLPLAGGYAAARIPVREDQVVVGLHDGAPSARFAGALLRGTRSPAGALVRARRLVVGVIGGTLVAAPSARQARATAGEPTVVLAGTHGALTVRADLATLGPTLASTFGIQLGSLDEAVGFAIADRQGIRATIRVGIR